MTLRIAPILAVTLAAGLALPLAGTRPAEAGMLRCPYGDPMACEWVPVRPTRDARAAFAAYDGWTRWVPVAEPRGFTRFDIEALRLMQRMP